MSFRPPENGPVVIDLVSQRAEFAAVIERSRIDGLIKALRRRAQSGGFWQGLTANCLGGS